MQSYNKVRKSQYNKNGIKMDNDRMMREKVKGSPYNKTYVLPFAKRMNEKIKQKEQS